MNSAATQAVIFDLDGTLVQTRVSSWEVFEKISKRFDLGIDRPEQYFDLFRGNVYASISELCRDETQATEVKEAFLQLLRDEYSPPLVPGIADVVRRLAAHCTLALMSSNATQVLRRVLEPNGLAFCFAHVFGGDVNPDKRAAIRSFLADTGSGFGRRCRADYDEVGGRAVADPAGTVLVTDTVGDVRDALEVGIRVVGVAWGMHSVDELTAAGAEFVALWPQEIAAHLLAASVVRPAGDAGATSTSATTTAPSTSSCGCGGSNAADGPTPLMKQSTMDKLNNSGSTDKAGPPQEARADDAVAAAAAVRPGRRRAAAARLAGPGPGAASQPSAPTQK